MTTIDQKLAEMLNGWTVNSWPVGNFVLVLIALLLSLLLCGAVGLEREIRGRSAGLRTHLLVGVGSCVVMVISIYGFPAMFGEKRDVARLAAQVISGVGFLGAGAIIYHNAGAKGLTTAGTIWLSMAIGLACGSMNFILAIAATSMIMFVLLGLKGVDRRIAMKKPTLQVVAPANLPVVTLIMDVCEKHNCKMIPVITERNTEDGRNRLDLTFRVQSTENIDLITLSEEIRLATNAYSVQILSHM